MLRPWTKTASHEDLFIQHYDQLVGWALKIANQDRQLAEDLVHDAFVQFTRARPDLSRVQNLEGYLYTSLRNRHISHLRRNARGHFEGLPIEDYDSAAIGLRAVDPGNKIHAQDQLSAICRYACARKETSKAGSVLIVRFFHGYFPAEIARIVKGSRQAVDVWIRMARTEARIYLDNPRNLRFMHVASAARNSENGAREVSQDFLKELQLEIFGSRGGRCFSDRELKRLYAIDANGSISARALAHIVSCADCLEAVSRLLGLAPPSTRYPTDGIGPDGGPKPGRPSAARLLQTSQRSSAEVFEHSPTKLYVSVNGFFIGSQSINSPLSEVTISARIEEKIGFVEVFSEQGMLLLATEVDPPPDGEIEQSARVDLSEGRSLEMSLSFVDTWPAVSVVFSDPLYEATAVPEEAVEDLDLVASGSLPSGLGAAQPRLLTLLSSLSFWLRPAVLTAALAVFLIAVLLLVHMRTPSVRAAELLDRAAASERALRDGSEMIVHRTVAFEERDLSSGRAISQRKIEIWQSRDPVGDVVDARRVYDEQGRFMAGEWTKSDGSHTVYADGVTRVETPVDSPAALLTAERGWRLDPSAFTFSALVGETGAATVEEQPDAYVINYRPGVETGLLRATLKLNKNPLRAIEQRLVIEGSAGLMEYRFAEIGFERQPARAVAPSVFSPETQNSAIGRAPLRDLRSTPPFSGISQNPASASVELEIEAAYLLNAAGANTGEQVALTRTADGKLMIQGIVDTDQRKAEILQALKPVINNPAVRVEIRSVAEAAKHRTQKGSTALQRIEVSETSTIPVYAELRDHFSRRGIPSDRIEQEIREFSSAMLALSRNALRHAWALKRLADQISPQDVAVLSPEARAKRFSIIQEHARAFQRTTEKLRSELQPVLAQSLGTADIADEIEIKDESDLTRALTRLAEMASANDDAMRSAFTISTGQTTAPLVRGPRFWLSLRRAEKLAAQISLSSNLPAHPR